MRHRHPSDRSAARPIASLLCAATLLAASSAALAQPPPPPPPPVPADPPQAQQPGDDAYRALDDARRELESAQRDFENAARDAERERQRTAERESRRAVQLQESRRAAAEERQEGLEESRGELERARRELEAARRNLEEAAREVAQLSARTVGPIVQDFQLQWLGTGQRAMLGLVVEDDDRGARVTAVSPGGPADAAGVETGDVITAIDGRPLVDDGRRPSRALIERLSDIEPGATVSLDIARGDETRVIEVETRERADRVFTFEAPRFQVFTNLFEPDRWASMELVPLTPELGAYFGTERGLLVVRAPDDESLMLEDGDVILDINGREPNSPEHAMRILGTFEPGETIELTIMRRQQQMTLEIPVSEREPDRTPSSNGESA